MSQSHTPTQFVTPNSKASHSFSFTLITPDDVLILFQLQRRTEGLLLLVPFCLSDLDSGSDTLWDILKSQYHSNFEELQYSASHVHQFALKPAKTHHIQSIYEYQFPQHIPILSTPKPLTISTIDAISKPKLSLQLTHFEPHMFIRKPTNETRKIEYSTKVYPYPQYPYTHLVQQDTFTTQYQQYINNNNTNGTTTDNVPSNTQRYTIAEKLFYLPQLYDWKLFNGWQVPQFPYEGLTSLLYHTNDTQFKPITTINDTTTETTTSQNDNVSMPQIPPQLPYSLHWISLKQLRRIFAPLAIDSKEEADIVQQSAEQDSTSRDIIVQENSTRISVVLPSNAFNHYYIGDIVVSSSPTLATLFTRLKRDKKNAVKQNDDGNMHSGDSVDGVGSDVDTVAGHLTDTAENKNNITTNNNTDNNIDSALTTGQNDDIIGIHHIDSVADTVAGCVADTVVDRINNDTCENADDVDRVKLVPNAVPQQPKYIIPLYFLHLYQKLQHNASYHEDFVTIATIIKKIDEQFHDFFNKMAKIPQYFPSSFISHLIKHAWPALIDQENQVRAVSSYTLDDFQYIYTTLVPIHLKKLHQQLILIPSQYTFHDFSFMYKQQPNQNIWNKLALKQLKSSIIKIADSKNGTFTTTPVYNKWSVDNEEAYISNQLYLSSLRCCTNSNDNNNELINSHKDVQNRDSIDSVKRTGTNQSSHKPIYLATTINGYQFPLSTLSVTLLTSPCGILQYYKQLLDQYEANDMKQQEQRNEQFRHFEEEFQQELSSCKKEQDGQVVP